MAYAVFRYRCRRCQVIMDGERRPYDPSLFDVLSHSLQKEAINLSRDGPYIHACADGGWGIEALIGADVRDGDVHCSA